MRGVKARRGAGAVSVEDDGTQVVAAASVLNFGTGLSVTDNGAGAVTIDAAGGGGAAAGSMELIATAELAADGTITIDSIPNTYDHLRIVGLLRSTNAATADGVNVQVGTGGTVDTGSNYDWRFDREGPSGPGPQGNNADTKWQVGDSIPAANMGAGFFGTAIIDITGYAGGSFKPASWRTSYSEVYYSIGGGTWESTDPIDTIKVTAENVSNLAAGSKVWVYGIGPSGTVDAGDVTYDNTGSGLAATDTQAAIDELADETATVDDPDLITSAADLSPYRSPVEFPPLFRNIRSDVGVVALRFDDGVTEDYSYTFPALTARRLVASFAIISTYPGTTGYATWPQIVELQDAGMEIQCHSATHSSPADNAEFVTETTGAADTIRAQGLYVQSFVQPGPFSGDYYIDTPAKMDSAIGRWLQRHFAVSEHYIPDSIHTTVPGGAKTLPVPFRHGLSHITGDSKTYAELKAEVDRARAFHGYTEITFHSALIGDAGQISTADFEALLDYLEQERDAGRLAILTPTAAAHAEPGDPYSILGDGGFDLYPDDGAWITVGAPTIQAGGGPDGQDVVRSDRSNYLYQEFAARHLRSVRVTAWARETAACNARLQVQTFDSGGGALQNLTLTKFLDTSTWTRFDINIGCDPDTAEMQVRGWVSNSTQPTVDWCWSPGATAIGAGVYRS